MLPYEGLLLGVPEANAAVVGAADADVALALVLAEGKAWHQVFVADELPWKTQGGTERLDVSVLTMQGQEEGQRLQKLTDKSLVSL